MMIYLIVLLIAVSVSSLVIMAAQLVPSQSRALAQRLEELERMGSPFSEAEQRRRRDQRARFDALLGELGEWVERRREDQSTIRTQLVQAGYRRENAAAIFWGYRAALTLGLAGAILLVAPALGATLGRTAFGVLWGAALGWVGPSIYLDRRRSARQREIQKALPDALDMMVVCVEAGLGLNQAIVRVSEEIRTLSTILSEELALVNLEIRAGTPRSDALRRLGERTGVEDLQSLTTMLIQADRFGTSVAQALRVHADTLRTRRRQRAEEAAAKTSIKLLFPLLLCIFPTMFVVILGPGVIRILDALINV